MTLANLISLLRVLALPAIIYLLVQETAFASSLALLVFILAVLTDLIDGYLARKRKEVTKVGSFLDPFADKILIIGLFLFFVSDGAFNILFLAVFILRDIIAGVIRWMAARDVLVIKGTMLYGKLLTYAQFIIIFGLLLKDFFIYHETIVLSFAAIAVVLCIISVFHYGSVYAKGMHNRKKLGKEIEREKLVILTNTRSRGYHDRYRRHLLRIFARRRQAPIFYLPIKKDMYHGIEQKIKDYRQVIIAGGDGSFDSALNYKPLQKKCLGFFPLGAGNALYSYFYKGKRFEYLRSRFRFREVALDVLELEWEKGKIQTIFMSIGLDADIARLSRERTKHGFFDYLRGSWKAAFKAKADYNFNCTLDEKKYELKNCSTLTLAKVPFFGYGIRTIVEDVEADDRRVYGTACINTHSSFLNKPVRFWGLLLGMFNINKPPLLSLSGKIVVIKSEVPFPLQAGGEFLGYSKWIKVRVKRKQRVLMI